MNTSFLKTFIWVARLGSFRAAAEKLNVTQAAVSGRIASLENEFDNVLFDRKYRNLQLTPAGHMLLVHAERLLQEERLMREKVTGARALQGYVRLGIIESIVYSWMEPFLQRISLSHPALELELTADSTARLHELLLRGVIDIALQTDSVIGKDIYNIDLGEFSVAWITTRESNIPENASLYDLATIPIITFTRGSQPHKAVLSAFESENLRPHRLHCITSIAVITRLLNTLGGVASMPIASVRDQLANGTFRIVADKVPLAPLKLVASYRNDPERDVVGALAVIATEEMAKFSESMKW